MKIPKKRFNNRTFKRTFAKTTSQLWCVVIFCCLVLSLHWLVVLFYPCTHYLWLLSLIACDVYCQSLRAVIDTTSTSMYLHNTFLEYYLLISTVRRKQYVFHRHNFAFLKNEAFLVPQTIAETSCKQKMVVHAIKYKIPNMFDWLKKANILWFLRLAKLIKYPKLVGNNILLLLKLDGIASKTTKTQWY